MLNIEKMINTLNKIDKPLSGRERAAQILSVSSERLAEFERRYNKEVIDFTEQDGRYFDESLAQVRDSRSVSTQIQPCDEKKLEDIITRIVDGLLLQTEGWSLKDGRISRETFHIEDYTPITKEELQELPKELRPQLTAEMLKRDINGDSGYTLLGLYDAFKKAENRSDRTKCYNMFRQGLDILDLDGIVYVMLDQNPNSIGNWLPALARANEDKGFFRIPDTVWLKVPVTLLQLTRLDYRSLNGTTLSILDRYCEKAFGLKENGDYFVKTGTASSKFDFRNARINGPKEIKTLGEYLCYIHSQAVEMAGPLNRPCLYGMGTTNEWAVRAFIPDSEERPCIYKGLPLRCEYRIFADFDTEEILGMTPYWREDVMKKRFAHPSSVHEEHDYLIYLSQKEWLTSRYMAGKELVKKQIERLIQDVDLSGQWSLDVMQDGSDFYLIDMATADKSALNDCIPKEKLRAYKENWIPRLD